MNIDLCSLIEPRMIFVLLYVYFTLLNVLDGYTTWQVLKPDKYHLEINPVARWIFKRLTMPRGIIITEVLWISVYSLVLFSWAVYSLLIPILLLVIGVLVFTWVAWDGFRLIRKIKRPRL